MKTINDGSPAESLGQVPSMGKIQRQEDTRITAKEIFGANILTKLDGVICIGFKNINGFPDPATNPVKYDTLKAESGEHGF